MLPSVPYVLNRLEELRVPRTRPYMETHNLSKRFLSHKVNVRTPTPCHATAMSLALRGITYILTLSSLESSKLHIIRRECFTYVG